MGQMISFKRPDGARQDVRGGRSRESGNPVIHIFIAAALAAATGAAAQTERSEEHSFRVAKLVGGLEHPWSLAFLPDGRMLVTERPGRLRMISAGKLEPQPVAGLPEVTPHGQGGLHDVALHPDFLRNGLVYLAMQRVGQTA